MNWLWNALIILGMTLIISLISYYIFGVKGPWESFWIKTILLFLFLLAMSLWIKPIGPNWYEVQWVALIIEALLFILLLAAFSRSSDGSPKIPTNLSLMEKKRLANEYAREQQRAMLLSMGLMFWLLLVLLVVLILTGYYFK
jgi:hypothetical protein